MLTRTYVLFSHLSPVSPAKKGNPRKKSAEAPLFGSSLAARNAGNSSRTRALLCDSP